MSDIALINLFYFLDIFGTIHKVSFFGIS